MPFPQGLVEPIPRLLSGYRVGSVPYLNALPLTAGIESEILRLPPSQLAVELEQGRLDAALVSTAEILMSSRLRAMSGYGIVSRGPVLSVFLAHRTPLERLESVWVDPASLSSVNLLRVLLAERGLRPRFIPLESYEEAPSREDVLLIGNPALAFLRTGSDHAIWDLGSAWQELTGLPFTYALWAIQDGVEAGPLVTTLSAVARDGLARLPELIRDSADFDLPLRQAYVGGHIQHRVDDPARRGVDRFAELLERHTGRHLHPVRWLEAEPRTED